MEKFKIFLSHYSSEAPVAKRLKNFIEHIFAGAVDVFVASHPWSLRPGDPWEAKIRQELEDSEMVLVLLSEDSMTRPWVNFEAGAAWAKSIALVPMLHRGLVERRLIRPFSSHQAISLLDQADVKGLIDRIATESDLSPVVSEEDYLRFVRDIASLDHQIDHKMSRERFPKESRSSVRFYLYSKSHSQYRQNLSDAGDVRVFGFRKPEIVGVFEALRDSGRPDATIVSLDEYWVKELAETGRLEEVSEFANTHRFFDELMSSSTYEGKQWSVPHFLDFAYYTCRKKESDMLQSWLDDLAVADDISAHLDKLRTFMGTDRLLVYEFNAPDTAACVILEFIQSFGDKVASLQSRATAASGRNIDALKVLRGMVGTRPCVDFMRGEPVNLDAECEEAAFLRCWHSRMGDMPRSQETHMPMHECPIVGTLGGWHVGVLANAPTKADALQSLVGFLAEDHQQERLRLGAGLPTRSEFYENVDLARQRDPITGWTLAEIGLHVKGLITRSDIPSYSALRVQLSDLHDDIMAAPESETEEIFIAWVSQLP